MRQTCIFTGTKISPSSMLRQLPDYYTIHARRNLPDKEFRYLRTVIVTAAVHSDFDSTLSRILLIFEHRAGITLYTSACALAESCVFVKQLPGTFYLDSSRTRVPLIANLRGQFAEFLNTDLLARLRIFSLNTGVGCKYG